MRYGATLTPIGPYRAFKRTAAITAAPRVPASLRIDAAANCAEPANVVTDITIGATRPIDGSASTPKDIPNRNTAIENGATFQAPWAKV